MPRDIPVGNGRVLINFDSRYRIRDFFFPHPGRENQSDGAPFYLGVWVDGAFSWVSDDEWVRELAYQEDTLVTKVVLRCERMGIELRSSDAVDFYENVFLRRLVVTNLRGEPMEVRLFFHHDFHVGETQSNDTAFYDPHTRTIVHYERNRYFMAACGTEAQPYLDQWATGKKRFGGAEGTFRDAEDGRLSGNPIAQGSVDSTIAVTLRLEPDASSPVEYWIAAGRSYDEVSIIGSVVRERTVETLIKRTADYWRAWVNKESMNFGSLSPRLVSAFKRSLLIIRTNVDENGVILAANDGDVTDFNGDTYSYLWPRDGALVAYALDMAGFATLTSRFYTFSQQLITDEGYFLHKYTPDGAPGSSWHPRFHEGEIQLPIQEDETALMIWGLWKHYEKHRKIELIGQMYKRVIKAAADFMVRFRDPETSLPLPSWDLWEERRGVHTFTVATVWAGLQAAARFANLFGDTQVAESYLRAAREIKEALISRLYLHEEGRFARSILPRQGGRVEIEYDKTIDASLYAVWYFGVLAPDDPLVSSTMNAIRERLWTRGGVGGLARYEGDGYYRVSDDSENVPGNPWFICTLWMAQYDLAIARTEEELAPALHRAEWAVDRALKSGVMAEQVHPYSGSPLSVSPLTWSHSTYVAFVIEYLHKLQEMKRCDTCGTPSFIYTRDDTGVVPAAIGERVLNESDPPAERPAGDMHDA